MAGKQAYNQICPIASALDVVGSRWAMLVVRELSLGPRRFSDVMAGLETASTDMLTSRLRELEAAGLIARTDDRRYELTAMGFALAPVMRSMLIWSSRGGLLDGVGEDGSSPSIGPDPARRLAGMLGLIARTTSIDGTDQPVALVVEHLELAVTKGAIGYQLSDGLPEDPIGVITMSFDGLFALMVGGEPVERLLDVGHLQADTPQARQVALELGMAVAAVHAEAAQPIG